MNAEHILFRAGYVLGLFMFLAFSHEALNRASPAVLLFGFLAIGCAYGACADYRTRDEKRRDQRRADRRRRRLERRLG